MTPTSLTFMDRTTTQALSVPEAAEQRHSIRKYQPIPIPEEHLREILRLTSLAPSGFNAQPWRFVVVQDPDLKAGLHEAAYRQAQVDSAPAVIVLYTDMADTLATLDDVLHPGMPVEQRERSKANILATYGRMSEADCETWGAGQGNIALGYLLLAAQSLGYATSVVGGFELAKVKSVLGLPDHVGVPALIAIGVADEPGFSTHRHSLDRIARFR